MNMVQPSLAQYTPLQNCIGQKVSVCGTIHKIRRMTDFAFIILRHQSGLVQCIYDPAQAAFPLDVLAENMAVRAEGLAAADARSRSGFEIRLTAVKILSAPAAEPPFVLNGKELKISTDALLDLRPITLRHPKERAIFKIQAALCRGIRRFLDEHGFTEIHSPKLCSGTAEGGANVFGLDYFGRQAFLAQSPQFYKQMMAGVFERVYEIAPVFRAEKHDTARHINEYTSIDLEMAFIESCRDLMQLECAMLADVFAFVQSTCAAELALLGVQPPTVGAIPTLTFDEAKALIARTFGRPSEDPLDFDPEEEKLLCRLVKNETGSEFVFVTRYKSAKRPFYTMDCPDDPTLTESFDLLFRGLEITTGGQRIHDYGQQVQKMQARGMDIEAFSAYLMAHKYGLPPHGGMGIGLERLTAKLLGFDNVRRATLFPRDIKRLSP